MICMAYYIYSPSMACIVNEHSSRKQSILTTIPNSVSCFCFVLFLNLTVIPAPPGLVAGSTGNIFWSSWARYLDINNTYFSSSDQSKEKDSQKIVVLESNITRKLREKQKSKNWNDGNKCDSEPSFITKYPFQFACSWKSLEHSILMTVMQIK